MEQQSNSFEQFWKLHALHTFNKYLRSQRKKQMYCIWFYKLPKQQVLSYRTEINKIYVKLNYFYNWVPVLNFLYSFIMDWPDQKQSNQKQPPDKKNKPKYVAKQELQGQQPSKKAEYRPAESKTEKRSDYNNQNYNKKPNRPKQEREQALERPRFMEKQSSANDSSMHCAICSDAVRTKEPIWTCSHCFISLHLRCIKQWIKKTNEGKQGDDKKFLLNWACIQCKHQYHENMPEYYCFCGKFKNPQVDRDLEPHSCGKPCQRKRGQYCPHLCPQLCHSGKCPPCQKQGEIVKCNCGKTERMARCSEDRSIFQCGKKCEKTLTCGKHKCQRNCHYGQCFPCKKKHLVSCYCGKNDDVVECAQTSYACESVCDKLLNCGYHKCQKDCHEGPCGPCKKTPELQKNCNCGRYQIMMISELERQSCKDPIPSCGMPCKKKLSCGHDCPQICHDGRCPDCRVLIQQSCRCGATQRKIQCYKAKQSKDDFHCENICKKKRSCGIHVCNTECCKFRNYIGPEAHQCQLTCQRLLNCEKHTCDMPCHAGLCKKCPVIYSQPQPCPCGATSLRPPVLCGTITPECDNVCGKQMPCGHKCSNLCHYGACRCLEQVDVVCRCGNSKIRTTCGRQALCLTKCQKMLKCGHKCLLQCHAGTCEVANKDGCFKKCDKNRSDCGHKCKQMCHQGKKCEDFPCQAEILIKCQCGHRQTSMLCGSQGGSESTHKKKQILCNKKCENMKRFDIVYKGKQVYYPNSLIQYGFKNFNYLQRIEQRLEKYISESDSHFIEIQFKQPNDYIARMALHNLFQNHYHLNTHYYKHMKSATFTLTQTEHTMIPKPCLSEYIKQVSKGYIKRTNLPFQYTIKFDADPKQKAQFIIKSLKAFLHKYYVEKKDKMVHVHFWSKDDGIQAQHILENQNQTVHFYGEQNQNNYEELEEPIDMNQIIETQITQSDKTDNKTEEPLEKQQQTKQQIEGQKLSIPPQEKITVISVQNKKFDSHKQQELPVKKQSSGQKPKIIIKQPSQGSKIIIKKGAPNFVRSAFPPSSESVQDFYLLDDDQLFGDKVDWDALVKLLLQKKMGAQASEWRIRALIMINSFHKLDEKIIGSEFARILQLYAKDKEKASRILQIQKLEPKKIQQEMKQNQIYLSDHEPEIISYCILFNFFAEDKIQLNISDECAETKQVQRSLQIIAHVQKNNFEQFYSEFKNADYLLNCAVIPLVHEIRENFLREINKKQRVAVENLFKYLLFETEDELIKYAKQNGLEIGKRVSKSKKIEQYTLISGQLTTNIVKDEAFRASIQNKRDKSYFLAEPGELVKQKWMTRSFFAFGDFKQSISPKYMLALCRSLKQN